MISRKIVLALFTTLSLFISQSRADEHYVIDTQGMHAFITFKVKHLGYSWLEGRFNRFSGSFDYDVDNPANNKVAVEIDLTSIDTNHAERNKHLRDPRFFDTDTFPKASFVSTGWEDLGDGKAKLMGQLTLREVTKDLVIDVTQTGAGPDPWGGYRRGFEGATTLHLSDYKMKESAKLGPATDDVQIWLSIEGIRQ